MKHPASASIPRAGCRAAVGQRPSGALRAGSPVRAAGRSNALIPERVARGVAS